MSNKITVEIKAECRTKFSKVVEMELSDYDKYWELIGSDKKNHEIDSELADIAFKYGFDAYGDLIEDSEDLEEIEFIALDD
ncbi:hypothetical protein [Xenorhabdus sp. KK7.4]|uniref:hypothetical protein n=1 Tax=Xenorhabdus sp. KK7.4 TaxID=1851572 RepID=UPI000C0533ED|nr:hypothetical protein [Xenorhabdus sp. KK7.4]PHM50151.1 hypothetical protein Xekk_04229 [Xenorhabdus sp. KK7.4]